MDRVTKPEAVQFDGLIGPDNLLGLVRNTAPFLFTAARRATAPFETTPGRLYDLADHPLGWQRIIHAGAGFRPEDPPGPNDRIDYFTLCLACHFATAATYIPTDVDAKIRGVLWDKRADRGVLRRMADVVIAARQWDISSVSARLVVPQGGKAISGHDGEWLGVASGALGCFLTLGDQEYASRLYGLIIDELQRGADILRRTARTAGQELDVLRLAAILTHNVGDVDQGLSFWSESLVGHAYHQHLQHLAHENSAPFTGQYQIAATIYKQIMAGEGHRNYPLRAVKPLRSSAALLLPISPFLDTWGQVLASYDGWSDGDRGEVVAALLAGCRKIDNQMGYFRALAGIEEQLGGLERLAKYLPGSARSLLKDADLHRSIAIKRISFESALRKRTSTLLANRH